MRSPAFAQTDKIDAADTAWMIVATSIVLMMTIPGLALFYAGMVRKKNVLATMAQSLAATALVSILWVAFGYSWCSPATAPGSDPASRLLLAGMGMDSINPLAKTIPEALFMLYQMAFAVITVALVVGSVADRMRFSAFLMFSALWLAFVYVPIAHWVWGGGFLGTAGVLDFAGGTVVHINAGIAGLDRRGVARAAARLWLGKSRAIRSLDGGGGHRAVVGRLVRLQRRLGARRQFARRDGDRGHASGGLRRRPDLDVARMADPRQAVGARHDLRRGGRARHHHAGLGLCAALARDRHRDRGGRICFYACTALKARFKSDDSLDVFGVHGIGGITGTLLCGVFATAAVSIAPDVPQGYSGLLEGNYQQLMIQLFGVVVTMAWSGGMTVVLLKGVAAVTALRATHDEEREGLDISIHGEAIQ